MKKTVFLFVLFLWILPGEAALFPETLPYQEPEKTRATGTIVNDVVMPRVWLSHFGRTIESQAIENDGGDLLFYVQNGNFVVTKVIMLDENGEFVCAVNARGRPEFVPGFTVAADSLFVSSLGNIPESEACNDMGEQKLVELAKAHTPIREEVQVAGGPLLLLVPPAMKAAATAARVLPAIIRTATVLGSGCAIGLATELSNNPTYAGAAFGSSMGTVINMWPESGKTGVTLSRVLKGLGLGGAASIACDEGIYILEPQFVENVQEMFPHR